MIIDLEADPARFSCYDITDGETGERLPLDQIFHADDEAGTYRVYVRDDTGRYRLDAAGEPLREEYRRPVRITLWPNYGTEEEGLRRYHANFVREGVVRP